MSRLQPGELSCGPAGAGRGGAALWRRAQQRGPGLLWRRPRARSAEPGEEQRRPLSCRSPGCLSSDSSSPAAPAPCPHFWPGTGGGRSPAAHPSSFTNILEQEGWTQQGYKKPRVPWERRAGCTAARAEQLLDWTREKETWGRAKEPFRKRDKSLNKRAWL